MNYKPYIFLIELRVLTYTKILILKSINGNHPQTLLAANEQPVQFVNFNDFHMPDISFELLSYRISSVHLYPSDLAVEIANEDVFVREDGDGLDVAVKFHYLFCSIRINTQPLNIRT